MKCMALNQQVMCTLIRAGIVRSLLTVVVVMQLVACGGGGGGGGNAASGSGSGTLSSSSTTTATSNRTPTSGATTSSSTTSSQSSTNATASLSLGWVAPVARADGTPLSLADIDGYHIYYGNKAGSYPNRVKVTDATLQQVTLKNLASGTYYIVMTTYDVDGRESGYSMMVKKVAS
jgi:hypothetical protein